MSVCTSIVQCQAQVGTLCRVMTHDDIIPRMTNQMPPCQNYSTNIHVTLAGVKLPKNCIRKSYNFEDALNQQIFQ